MTGWGVIEDYGRYWEDLMSFVSTGGKRQKAPDLVLTDSSSQGHHFHPTTGGKWQSPLWKTVTVGRSPGPILP